MNTTTLPFTSENTMLSSLGASIVRFVKAACAPATPAGQDLMSLYRLAASSDSVSQEAVAALRKYTQVA